jgi:hypothetical protein
VLTFGGELDHGPIVKFSDFSALGNIAALIEEPHYTRAGFAQLLAEPAMCDLEATHRWSVSFGIVRGGSTVFAFEPGQIGAGGTDLLICSRGFK